MIRLWQDPDDDMYICTHGEIEKLPKDGEFYQCATTPWCEYAEEALSYIPGEETLNYVRELGAYDLLAQAETLEEIKLMQLLEDL